MPIKDLQVRMRELGRIRMGEKKKGSKFPTKLETWRLTSPSKKLLDAMAAKYGGTVTEWVEEKVYGEQWQLTTETKVLSVIVPSGNVGSQWYEMWSGDGCRRRCDGEFDTISGKACLCPADLNERAEKAKKGGACKPVTRLSFFLVGCPEVGLWRVQSSGRNAAHEMAAIAQVCELATKQNRVIPAELRLEQRQAKKPGQATSHFVVPVLDIGTGFDQILEQFGMLDGNTFAPSLAAPSSPAALPAARPDLPPDPGFTGRDPGPIGEVPPPPVPGPLGESDDDVVVAEIVEAAESPSTDATGGVGAEDTAGSAGTRSPASPASTRSEIVDTADGGSGSTEVPSPETEPTTPPVDESKPPQWFIDSMNEVAGMTAAPADEWDAERWRAEIRERSVAPRAVIAKAREIAGDGVTITKADDIVQHPEVAAAVRLWLDLTEGSK